MEDPGLLEVTLKRAYRDDLPEEVPDQFAQLLDALREQDKDAQRSDRHQIR